MTNHPTRIFRVFAFVAGALTACNGFAQAQGDKYAGVWNYDQPGASSGINIGKIHCPATSKGNQEFVMAVPQVGNLTLTRRGDGLLEGRTDQGCTWTFVDKGSSVELSPVPQSCFNKVIGSSYTMTNWSVHVDGNHQTESLTAKSHHPMGDCDFEMAVGNRTKVDNTDSSALFAGVWTYDEPNPRTRTNMLQYIYQGEGEQSGAPQTGTVTYSRTGAHTLRARTANGCSWQLDVHGNMALLAAPQTCHVEGSTITMNHWTIASDGEHQSSVMKMTEDAGGKIRIVLLGTGNLSRESERKPQ